MDIDIGIDVVSDAGPDGDGVVNLAEEHQDEVVNVGQLTEGRPPSSLLLPSSCPTQVSTGGPGSGRDWRDGVKPVTTEIVSAAKRKTSLLQHLRHDAILPLGSNVLQISDDTLDVG